MFKEKYLHELLATDLSSFKFWSILAAFYGGSPVEAPEYSHRVQWWECDDLIAFYFEYAENAEKFSAKQREIQSKDWETPFSQSQLDCLASVI